MLFKQQKNYTLVIVAELDLTSTNESMEDDLSMNSAEDDFCIEAPFTKQVIEVIEPYLKSSIIEASLSSQYPKSSALIIIDLVGIRREFI